MKKQQIMYFAILSVLLSGCSVVGGIFKAGVWVGVLAIVVLIVIILAVISKAGKK